MNSSSEKTEAEVIREEAVQILARRAQAFPISEVEAFRAQFEPPAPATSSAGDSPYVERVKQLYSGPPVGMAISGGGIRSASTALGLLQSMYRTGLLRFVDYLSTVSGGTYAGALLAAEFHSLPKPIDHTPEDPPPTMDSSVLPIVHKHRTPQPPIVRGLSTAAESLKKPLVFLSRHLWGLLTVNAFLISGMIAATAGLAWLFRSLDQPTMMLHLAELGFQTDFARAMFPAAVAFWIWAVSALVAARWGRNLSRFPPISAYAYAALLLTLALGIVLLFSTANLDLQQLEIWANKDNEFGNRIRNALGMMGQALAVLIAVAIAPLFRIHDIVRSGTSGTRVERWIFNLVATTALFGVPLVLFYFLSAENISGIVQPTRNLRIGRGTIHDKDVFFEKLLDDAGGTNQPQGAAIGNIDLFRAEFAKAVEMALQPKPDSEDEAKPGSEADGSLTLLRGQVKTIRELQSDVRERNSHCQWFPLTLINYFTSDRIKGLADRRNLWEAQDKLADAVNTCLSTLNENPEELTVLAQKWKKVFANPVMSAQRSGKDTKKANLSTDETPTGSSRSSIDGGSPANNRVPALIGTRPIPDESISETDRITLFETLWKRHESLMTGLNNVDDNSKQTKAKLVNDLQNVRWNMMRVAFDPEVLYPPTEIFASVVCLADQDTRLRFFFWSSLVFVTLGLVFSVNTTTNHGFYRDQIASRWIAPHSKEGDSLALCELNTASKGGPMLIINNTVNLGGRQAAVTDNRLARMILTPRYTGCDRLGFRETKDLLGGHYTLADATALSGAAVSPLVAENVLARALLIITNFRLGQWLPNPSSRLVQNSLAYPRPFVLLWEHFFRPPEHRSFLFVSDGGHHENTGIESLFVRRCRVIISADFSEDGSYDLADFRKLCLRAAEQLGVQLFEQPSPRSVQDLRPTGDPAQVKSHLAVFKILYPRLESDPDDGGEGWLILIKPGLSGDEPAGLQECGRNFAKFPHDPTGDQLFEETRFMAYRQLGEHLGEDLYRFFSGGGTLADGTLAQLEPTNSLPNYRQDPRWLSRQWSPASQPDAEASTGAKGRRKDSRDRAQNTATRKAGGPPSFAGSSPTEPLPGDQ
jgi:hypothetical protein